MAYTNINDPSAYFQTALYAGNNTTDHNITNDGNSDLQPDFVWIKQRTSNNPHVLHDTSRGFAGNGEVNLLVSNTTGAEATNGGFESFNTNGFGVGGTNVASGAYNLSGSNYVAWQWKANGGTTASNTDGDINSTVQVNQDAGFSIVTYTGNGSTSDQTIGHGLGVRANAVIVKNRDSAVNWVVYVDGLTANHSLELNTADGESDSTQGRVLSNAGSRGTSTIFSIRSGSGSVVQTNTSGEDYVAYCFAEKQGYSKFSSYVGNGTANNGPFVYLGFKPAFVMIKSTAATGAHIMWDLKRSPFNLMDDIINAAEADAESTNGIYGIDVVSNGFKIKNTGANNGTNQSGTKYVYYAFAENPFVTSTGVPTTAR
jgi:hypothetical protein